MENNSLVSTDLNLAVTKFRETLDSFQTQSFSIVSISEQCRNMERTYDMAEKEIDEKSVVLEVRRKEIDERRVVLEEREREINEKSVVLEEWRKKIEEKSLVLEERSKGIDEKSVVLEAREKEIGERSDVLEEREKEVNEKSVLLEKRRKKIDEKSVRLEERRKGIDEKSLVLEAREKEISERSIVLEERKKEMYEKSVVLEERECLHLRIKEMTQIIENLELTQKKLIEGQRLSNLRRGKLIEIGKDMTLTEARINEELASLEVKEKAISTRVDALELEDMETNESFEDTINQLFKNMDVKGVLSYVIENETEVNVFRETLLNRLLLAPNPAKLVLGVTQSFHDLESGNNHGFNGKLGCINLLVGLMKIEADVSACVRKEAKIFAANLGSCVVRQDCSPLDVFCFLQFVVSFKLYDTDEILMFLQAFCVGREVCWPDENTMFRYELGLSQKLSALVQSLISGEKHLEAVLYICAFKMEDTFSLEPLLDAHLKNIRMTEETVPEASSSAQDAAASMELTALRNMLKYISYFKLEPYYSTNSVKLRIAQFEKEIEKYKVMAELFTVKIEKN